MRNLVVAKASAGMSTTVTMSGNHALKPPDPDAASAWPAALASPSGFPSAFLSDIANQRSALQVDQFLEHLIAGGDDARVGLVSPLRGNQVGQLRRQIDVGQFQRAGLNAAQTV